MRAISPVNRTTFDKETSFMKKPKILSVKLGYNPNSSSIGIMVKIFLWGALAVNILLGLLNILITLKSRNKHQKETSA
jgi:hypothetical protein